MHHFRFLSLIILIALLTACGGADDRKSAYRDKADEFFASGNYEKARLEYKNVLQIDPKDADAHYQLAQVMEKLQDWRAAAAQYAAVLEIDERHTAARVRLGQFYLLGKVFDKAMDEAETALVHAPESADALAFRGTVKAQQGNISGAVSDAEAALKADPRHINAIALKASLQLREGNKAAAIALLRNGIEANSDDARLRALLARVFAEQGKNDQAAALLEEIIVKEPNNLAHRLRLVSLYTSMENLDKAEEILRRAVSDNAENTQIKLALIEFLAGKRNGQIAIDELKKHITAEPDNYPLQFALAKIYEAGRDAKQALATYEKIIIKDELGPHGLSARTRMAQIHVKLRELDEAKQLLEEVLTTSPNDQQALSLRGQIFLFSKDPTSAISDFRAAMRDQPNSIQLHRLLARAHIMNKETELAKDMLKRAIGIDQKDMAVRSDYIKVLAGLGDNDGVVEQLDEVLKISPDNLGALEALFKVQSAQKDWQAATTIADRIKSTHPDKALGYYFNGLLLQAQNQLQESLPEFRKALELSPDAIQPLTQLIKSHLALKDTESAIEQLDEVLNKNAKNFVAYNLKGEVSLYQKNMTAAAEAFEQAISIKPDWPLPYRNLANLHLASKDRDNAIVVYQRGVEATKGSPLMVTALAGLYEISGNTEEAIKLYEATLIKDENNAVASNNLAMLLIDHRGDESSLKRAASLIESLMDTSNPAYLDTIGWLKYKQGNAEDAISYLKKAVDAAPKTAGMRYHLGVAYLKAGDKDAAKVELEIATMEGANYKGLDEAQSALKSIK